MDIEYVPGQWYRDGRLVFCVEFTGRIRRDRQTGEWRSEVRNKHTINCSSEQVALVVLAAMQERETKSAEAETLAAVEAASAQR